MNIMDFFDEQPDDMDIENTGKAWKVMVVDDEIMRSIPLPSWC
jgi:hypothetical protein